MYRSANVAVLCGLALSLAFTSAPARALTESQQDAAIASLQNTVAAQQTTINALMAKLQYVTASGHDLTLTGNLHVVSGSEKTNGTPNGLGNVIIGYNESRGSNGTDTRTGSHNLILGSQNNFSSYGSIVAGVNNSSRSGYASVTGGKNNTASGFYSSVTGGYGNTASGSYATVGGGNGNTAGGLYAFLPLDTDVASINTQITSIKTTAASQGNSLASLHTSVTGATAITNLFSLSTDSTRSDSKPNTELTLTGVNLHIVNGLGATNGEPGNTHDNQNPMVNGLGNLIIGYNESRMDDPQIHSPDTRTGSHNLILGYENNYSSFGGIVAGHYNSITAPFASAVGSFNTASGYCSSAIGGDDNLASGINSSVSGGYGNTANAQFSSASGGNGLTVTAQYGWAAGSQGSTAYSGNFTSP